MRIVVTDLTRFNNRSLLCMAGLSEDGTICIRPLQRTSPSYLSFADCRQFNVLPGSIFESDFTPIQAPERPHIEDHYFQQLTLVGSCNSAEFENVLRLSAVTSISAGFGIPVTSKVIETPPARSIITLVLHPRHFSLSEDYFNKNKIKATLTDSDGLRLTALPITDLGFYDFVGNADTRRMTVEHMNEFIAGQERLYLRLGLSRRFTAPDGRTGYWLQINGIYTFPNFERVVRSY